MRFVSASVLLAFLLAGCAQPCECPTQTAEPNAPVVEDDRLVLAAVSFADLPGWASDRHADAVTAYRESCRR